MIRKLFNIPTKSQRVLIDADIQNIMNKCDVIASSEYRDQKEAQESRDSVCPNCRARKSDIVNKVRQVEGSGNVSGSFSLGFGSINGSMSIDTNEVNHCNKCGNEWKKYKIRFVSKSDIIKVTLGYLVEIISDEKHKEFSWKIDAIKVFDNCCAESIARLTKQYGRISTKDILTIRRLRKHYNSVYDKENKKKLEKI
jgi:hypothetical protein